MELASFAIYSVPVAWGLAIAPIIARAVLVSVKGGKLDNTKPRDRDGQVKGMAPERQALAARLLAAHNNQLETLGYYAAGVAVAVAVRVPPETLNKFAGYYLKCRLAYNLAYASPQIANGALRSLSFLAAMTSVGLIYVAAAQTAISTY